MSTAGVLHPITEEEVILKGSPWIQQVGLRLIHNRTALVGLVIMMCIFILAVIAPLIARFNPDAINIDILNSNPTSTHWLGTDYLGRDMWSRLLYGARISLPAGMGAVLISFWIGVPMGITAGYSRKLIDDLLMRLVDIMLAFPGIILAIGIVTILGPGIISTMIAVGVGGIPGYARISRGSTLEVRSADYVMASIAQGSNKAHIMTRHIAPNIIGPLVVLATLNLSGAILATSALSFLGLGTQLPAADWGTMLSQGYEHMFQSWAQVTFPGLMILITVFGINLLGDGLGEALNPQILQDS